MKLPNESNSMLLDSFIKSNNSEACIGLPTVNVTRASSYTVNLHGEFMWDF